MTFPQESSPSGVDPLGSPPTALPEDLDRLETAPESNNNKNNNQTGDDDGDSNGRIYIWLSIACAIIGAVIIVVVVLVGGGETSEALPNPLKSLPPVHVATYAPEPVIDDPQVQLDMIRAALDAKDVTRGLLDLLPETPSALQDKFLDQDADPVVRAASWVVLEDEYNHENQIVERFALAAVYYQTNGDDWTLKTNWLTSTSFCDGWHGVVCCGSYPLGLNVACQGKHPEHVSELDLEDNNLTGSLPTALALIDDLFWIDLSWNDLSGPVDGAIFASLPNLQNLLLQMNRFTGPIDTKLIGNGVLSVLYIQGNFFTGEWPIEFCAKRDTDSTPVLNSFHLDCYRNPCPSSCCTASSEHLQTCTRINGRQEGDEDNFNL